MKLSSTFTAFMMCCYVNISLLLASTKTVEAKLLMKVLLNDGVLPTQDGYTCTEKDFDILEGVLDAYGDQHGGDGDDDRRLSTTRCRDDCRGVVTGFCHVTKCKGHRRRTQKLLRLSSSNKRILDDDEKQCSTETGAINIVLQNSLPNLSESCQHVVQNTLTVTCFDDVKEAAVERFTLWNATADTVVTNHMKNGDTYCFTNNTLNIEAVANAYVEEMELFLSGPVRASREQESAAPYTIFGHTPTSTAVGGTTTIYNNFGGRVLPIGSYTIRTAIENSIVPSAKINFKIVRCS